MKHRVWKTELKAWFTAPVLHLPYPDKPFVLEVDVLETDVGAILSQQHGQPPKLFPCALFSRKLSTAERNYNVCNRELLAVKLETSGEIGWKEADSLLLSTQIKRTRFTCRWLDIWMLSRSGGLHPSPTFHLPSCTDQAEKTQSLISHIHEPLKESQTSDTILPKAVFFALVSWNIQWAIQQATRGVRHTHQLLPRRYWWPTLSADVKEYARSCVECTVSTTQRQLLACELHQSDP